MTDDREADARLCEALEDIAPEDRRQHIILVRQGGPVELNEIIRQAAARIRALATENAALKTHADALAEALGNALLQLEYLDEKYPTGTTAGVLAQTAKTLAGYAVWLIDGRDG